MGTWGYGPFDNDTAADWCNDLDDAPSEHREHMVRAALTAAAGMEEYLESDVAQVAIAAAAIVVAHRPGGRQMDSAYAPEFLVSGGRIELPESLAELAVRALDRVVGDNSEWRELLEESGRFDKATITLLLVRRALAEWASDGHPDG